METSLDWQIETLQTEVQALNGMIAILNNARSIVNDYSKDSKTNPSPFLSHIHELVHIQKQNQQNRQQFVLTKIEEIGFMSDIPAEWQDAFSITSISTFFIRKTCLPSSSWHGRS